MGFLSRLAQAQRQAQGEASAPAPRPTLIQGGPAFFTPEGYVPPVQPEQAFMPTDVMRDPIADMFAAQPPLTRGPSLPKMINPPKRPDQLFIDDMPPMREEPPMDFPMPQPPVEMPIVEDDPIMRSLPVGDPVPFVPPPIPSREDFMSIGGPGGGYTTGTSELMDRMFPDGPQPIPQVPLPVTPPVKENPFKTAAENPFQKIDDPIPQSIIDQFQAVAGKPNPFVPPIMPPMREVPPEDFGFGPGIRRSEDFFRGEDLIMPPMAPPKPLGEDVPPMPMENIIRANDPAIMPMPPKMPMLPEPMPMPMPIRPRMPMPGPIATPMPMAPTNLQLPQIETQMPMMSLDRGIGSFSSPNKISPLRMMAEGGEVVEPLGEFSEDLPLTNYIFSLQSPERSELVNNLIGVTGITVGSAESIPMFVKRLIQTGSLKKPEVKEVIQESLEKNTSQ